MKRLNGHINPSALSKIVVSLHLFTVEKKLRKVKLLYQSHPCSSSREFPAK